MNELIFIDYSFQSSVCSPSSLSKMMVVVLQKIEMAPVTLPPNVLTKEVNLVEVVLQGKTKP